MKLDAFHLPTTGDPPTTSWSYAGGGTVELRIPRLTTPILRREIDGLLRARDAHLAARPVAAIVESIDAVARRLLDDGDAVRRAAVEGLAAVTSLSTPMVRHVLDRMAADWRAEPLRRLLEEELADPGALDGFVARGAAGRRVRAYGPRLAVHVFSGNVPGVSVTSLVRSLLTKSATLGKTATGEPVLAPLFARALAEADPGLGACLAVTHWAGGDEALETVALERADAVIGYGGSEAIASLRDRTPASAAFHGYGHRVSFGMLAREGLDAAGTASSALAAALAVATFDQQGCVSPHLFYVEEGGETPPAAWAAALAREMAAVEDRLPRGALSPGESSSIRQARGEAEFAQISGGGVELHASAAGTAWTVIFDPDPAFSPSCLNRLVRVKPIARLDDVIARVEPLAPLLQTVGVHGPEPRIGRLAEALGQLGASRIAPLDRMAWPPPVWHHDGRPPLAGLLRWTDWED